MTTPVNKTKNSKRPAAKFKEDASVLVNQVDGAELRLTTLNRLFVVHRGRTAFPYLNGETVKYDVLHFDLSSKAIAAVKALLVKQAEIRRIHALDFDEDESAFTYN